MTLREFRKAEILMGNAFEITVVGTDEVLAYKQIDSAIVEIKRIERLFSTYKTDSQTNLINTNAGIKPVKVDSEVFGLIERSLRISSITNGYFDITYGGVDKNLWNFDKSMTRLPDVETAKNLVHLINYQNVILNKDHGTVYLKEKGMRIGFGGIGKGYAAEMAKNLLKKQGVPSGIINASGDLTVWGTQADGKPWTVGIANPDHARLPFSYLNLTDTAIATSGNYEKYVKISGKKYSHTINPKTGMPITGIKSVTVICPNAEIADATATPISLMGVKASLEMINQIHQIECIIIDDKNKIFTSKNINLI